MKKSVSIGLLLIGIVVLAAGLAFAGYEAMEQPSTDKAVELSYTQSDAYTVVVKDGQFMPVDLQLKAGDTVEWVNLDEEDHTVSFESCAVELDLPVGATARYTFTEQGTLYYASLKNPSAQGSVTVN